MKTGIKPSEPGSLGNILVSDTHHAHREVNHILKAH